MRIPVTAWTFALAALAAGAAQAQESVEDYRDLWYRGEYRKALHELDARLETMRHRTTHYRELLEERAQLLFEVGRIDEAIEDLRTLFDSDPRDPSYALNLALLYKYRGKPNYYQQTLASASVSVRSRNWHFDYRRRDKNVVAVGRIYELTGLNPKTILSAHYKQAFDNSTNLPAFVYVGAGDIAYGASGYDVAANYYKQALERNADNQAALAGLAECYWKSNDERLEPVLQRLLDANPNHPRANALLAEQALDQLKTEEAHAIIDRMLAINPVNYRFLGLKSAALFLEDRLQEMRTLQKSVQEYNPVGSEVFRITGRLASRHYRFKQGAEFQELALAADPDDYEARALYTLDLMRLGREQEGREELEAAFEADPFNVQLYNLLELMDTLQTFETVTTDRFVLRLPKEEAPILEHEALRLLDEAFAHFEDKYAVELETPVLIEMFDDHDDFMVRSVGLPGNVGHLGICFGNVVTMDTPSVRRRGSSNWRSVLWHEFVHVITLQKTNNRMPRWLSEGISVYEEGQRTPAWRNRLDPNYRQVLAVEGKPDVEELDAYFTQAKSPMHLMFGYFAAGEFVQFYADTYGHGALVGALEQIAGPVRAVDALTVAADTTLPEMNEGFHGYLDERLAPYDNLPEVKVAQQKSLLEVFQGLRPGEETNEPETMEPAASPFTDRLTQAREAIESESWDDAIRLLQEAYELFPDYRGEDAPLRLLAQVYDKLDKQDERRKTLEELVYDTPTELTAAVTLLDIYTEREKWDDVKQTAEWAIGIDPYDPAIHRAFVTASRKTEDFSDALESIEVLLALDAPQASEYRLEQAEVLLESGKPEDAKQRVLGVLEDMPYYWKAQRLLLEIIDAPGAAETDRAAAGRNSRAGV